MGRPASDVHRSSQRPLCVLTVDVTIDAKAGGGCAERAFQLLGALSAKGVTCTALMLDYGRPQERLNTLSDVKSIVLPCLFKRFFIPWGSPRLLWRIVRRSDVIHFMPHWTMLNAIVFLLARIAGTPYAVCPAGSLPIQGRSQGLKRLYNELIGKRLIRQAQALIAISTEEVEHFRGYGAADEAIRVIPNGICPTDYDFRDDEGFRRLYGLPPNPFVLFMGRLNPIKGPDLLVKAFAALPPSMAHYHLALAGPDEGMQGCLQTMVQQCGLADRVHFLGFLAGRQKACALHAASLLTIPSRREAMSIVVLEAGACAIPVLATDRCGLGAIADAGGAYLTSATPEAISQGLALLLSDALLCETIGKRLRELVLTTYTWDVVVEDYLSLFEAVVTLRRPNGENAPAVRATLKNQGR